MRNLKRALSLALASVMLLGMMVVGTSAASYPDVDDKDHVEAIEVLSAVGVIVGDNGNFRPDDNVSRNEMAVIMAKLILGTYEADSYVGSHPFTDVPDWASRYVAACYSAGIIAGRGEGIYDGASTVTAVEAAAMMLRALGYEDLSLGAKQWDQPVAAKANEINLFDGLSGSSQTPMDRNSVAQLSLNTLKATMVTTTRSGQDINLPDGTTVVSARNYNDRPAIKGVDYDGSDDSKLQLCEYLYGKDLKLEDDTDDFKRPASTWTYKNDDVITTADDADETLVLDKELDYNEAMVTDDDYFNYDAEDVPNTAKVYVNGDLKTTHATDFFKAGDVVEVYEDDGKVTNVCVTRYSLAVIDEIETSLSSTHTNRGASCSITLEDLDETAIGGTYYDAYSTSAYKVLNGFNASTYTEGTVLAIALNDDEEILASHVAETVEGAITAVNTGSKATVTVDSKQYPIHSAFDQDGTAGTADSLETLNLKADSYAVYLDANGYVIGIGEAEVAKISDVYYVTGILKDNSRYVNYYAQAISLEDGTVKEFLLKDSDADTNRAITNNASADDTAISGSGTGALSYSNNFAPLSTTTTTNPAGLFTFQKDGSKYTAKRYVTSKGNTAWKDSDSTYEVVSGASDALLYMTEDLARDDTKMTLGTTATSTFGTTSRIYLDNETNYLKVEKNGKDLDAQLVTGGTSIKWDTDSDSSSDVKAIAVTRKDGNGKVASYVILVSTDFKIATSDNVVFVSSAPSDRVTYTDKNGDKKVGYDTEVYFMDGTGKIETITVETDSPKAPGFYTWEINDDDVYELASANQKLTSGAYSDQTGYIGFALNAGEFDTTKAVGLTRVYKNKLTVDTVTDTCKTLDDVAFGDNVIVRDDRDKSDRDADMYTGEITSVSALESAIKRCADNGAANGVKAIVYLDDEKVIMVYVLAVQDNPAAPGPGPGPEPGPGDEGELPRGFAAVDTSATAITIEYTKDANSGKRPTDEQVVEAIIAQLKEEGYEVAADGYGYDGTTPTQINITGKKTGSAVSLPKTWTFDTAASSTAYLVKYSKNGTEITNAVTDTTAVSDSTAANVTGSAYAYVQVDDTKYVLSNSKVKPGADYTDPGKLYAKVKLTANVTNSATTGLPHTTAGTDAYEGKTITAAFKSGKTEEYVEVTSGNFVVTVSTNAATGSKTGGVVKAAAGISGMTGLIAIDDVASAIANNAAFDSANSVDITFTLKGGTPATSDTATIAITLKD